MGRWVLLHQRVGSFRGANEGKDVDEPGGHDGGHGVPPTPGDEIHHTGWEALGVRLHGQEMRQSAGVGDLHDHRVAHEQRGDQGGVGLVERVVRRAEVQHDAHRGSLQHCMDSLLADDALAAHVARSGDQRRYEVHGAVELLRGVGVVLADLPLEDTDDLCAHGFELNHERLNRLDALLQRLGWPGASPPAPGLGCGLHGIHGGVRGERCLLADLYLPASLCQVDR
mmetsp:Transcript_81515/g.239366  ORF Transcript_81515/g.239366 Transcript_81515/m.239366 type:complete len:226 (-) Transcript_81515:19-696(-)